MTSSIPAFFGGLALACIASTVSSAQVVSVIESPLRRYAGPGEQAANKGADPTPATRFYVAAVLSSPGAITDASGNTTQIAMAAGFQFPSVRFTFSVAPRLMANDSAPVEQRRSGELIRLNANVRVQALDAAGSVIAAGSQPAIEVLAISPSEGATAAAAVGNAASEAKQGLALLAAHVGPIGAAVMAFESAFHRAPAPAQVAYQAAPDEFGWRWFRGTDAPIDGLHYTSALIQAPAGAASLRLSIELITDWDRFGAWVKTYDLVVKLK